MKRKNIILAAVGILTLVLIGVIAQVPLRTTSITQWFRGAAAANLPATQPHDRQQVDDPTSGTFHDTLANPQVSVHQDGDTVVLMTATGDLPGVLTLKLHRSGTAITGGEFAFNVSYTKVTEIPDADKNKKDGGSTQTRHEDHSEALIQRGSIMGTITGGAVTLDGSDVISINTLQLNVNRGSMEFSGVLAGSGSGDVSNLLDFPTSTGALTLTF